MYGFVLHFTLQGPNEDEPRANRHSRRRGRIINNKIAPLSFRMERESMEDALKVESPESLVPPTPGKDLKAAKAACSGVYQSRQGDIRGLHKARRAPSVPMPSTREEIEFVKESSKIRPDVQDEVDLPGMVPYYKSANDNNSYVQKSKDIFKNIVDELGAEETEKKPTYMNELKRKMEQDAVNKMIKGVIENGVKTLMEEEDQKESCGKKDAVDVAKAAKSCSSEEAEEEDEFNYEDDFEDDDEDDADDDNIDIDEKKDGDEINAGASCSYDCNESDDNKDDDTDADEDTDSEEDKEAAPESTDDLGQNGQDDASSISSDDSSIDEDDDAYERRMDAMINDLIMKTMNEITHMDYLMKTRSYLFWKCV